MSRKLIILLLIVAFYSCNKPDQRVVELKVDHPENSYFVIKNNGAKTAYFTIDINGKGVYNMDKMVAFIEKNYQNMPNAEKVWRFVSEYSRHNGLITRNNWLYNPLLLMNSAGGSLCGFRSAAMTNILLFMGEKARSWCVNGHVVTEAYVDGKWQLYDPDLGVVYYNESGEVCSFNELCNNPQLISKPYKIVSISSICDSLNACSDEIAALYSPIQNKELFNTSYTSFAKKEMITMMLPPGATISFPQQDKSETTTFALAELQIPPKWVGVLHTPLIPYNYSGNAKLNYLSKYPTESIASWAQIVSSSSEFESKITINENLDGLIMRYYVNPLFYIPQKDNKIEIIGYDIDYLEFSVMEYPADCRPDWVNYCDELFGKWFVFIDNSTVLQNSTINSYQDFLHQLLLLENCKEFATFNVDTVKINKYLKSMDDLFIEKDSSFWQKFNNKEDFIQSWLEILRRSGNV